MKQYYIALKKQKEKDLQAAQKLSSAIGVLGQKSSYTDSTVKKLQSDLGATLKGDNKAKIVGKAGKLNEKCSSNASSASSLVSTLISKIQKEIAEIQAKIAEIERREAAERREAERKREEERKKKKEK